MKGTRWGQRRAEYLERDRNKRIWEECGIGDMLTEETTGEIMSKAWK